MSQLIANGGKITIIGLRSPFSPDLTLSDLFLFSDLRRILTGKKKIGEAETKANSYYKKRIEKLENLEDRYNRCIDLDDTLNEKKA